jgi:DNA ligase (NAD+)
LIEENGGTVASGISRNVHFLLAGDDAGSKLQKANKLGIPAISEDEFLTMIA